MILQCCQDPQKHHRAVYEKYSGPKYKEASTYVEREVQKGYTLNFPLTLAVEGASPMLEHNPHREFSNPGPLLIPTRS